MPSIATSRVGFIGMGFLLLLSTAQQIGCTRRLQMVRDGDDHPCVRIPVDQLAMRHVSFPIHNYPSYKCIDQAISVWY